MELLSGGEKKVDNNLGTVQKSQCDLALNVVGTVWNDVSRELGQSGTEKYMEHVQTVAFESEDGIT